MHCYNAKTGNPNWEAKGLGKGAANILAVDDKVFCCAGKTLSCLNAQDGKNLWQFTADNYVSLPTVSDRKIYFGTQTSLLEESSKSKDYFYCLDLQTGTQDWSIEMESPVSNSPVIIGNYACIMDCKNRVYIGFDLSEQKRLWQNSDASELKIINEALHLMINDKWSVADIATGQITKQLDFGANYSFVEQRNYSLTNDYVQCNVPGSIVTDSMFESPPRTRLQRVYSNDNVYVSNYPNIAAGKVYGFTVRKKLWETPNDWTLEPTNFPGVSLTYAYFWVFNDKVLVMRKENNAYFYTCLDKSTGKKLWEMPKGNYRIDAFDNGILTLHSITGTKDIDINDGSIKNERPTSFDKQIIFEIKLSGNQLSDGGACVYDLSEGFYLYVTYKHSKHKGIEKDRYLVDKNGKITPLYIYNQDFEFENIRRYKSKLYVMSKTSDDVFDIIEVDIDTGKSRSVKESDVPTNTVLLQKAQNNESSEAALNNKIIKKIGIKPHKPDDEYYSTYIKGIYYAKYLICQRQISEGMEYITPYSDYTGVYDAKTLKKLWSYDKNVGNIYFHESTIIINGNWENKVVLFNDLATGKTLLKYDNATLLSKVGDICFVASGDKLIAVNLKKLPK